MSVLGRQATDSAFDPEPDDADQSAPLVTTKRDSRARSPIVRGRDTAADDCSAADMRAGRDSRDQRSGRDPVFHKGTRAGYIFAGSVAEPAAGVLVAEAGVREISWTSSSRVGPSGIAGRKPDCRFSRARCSMVERTEGPASMLQ
jgi:hypothetical protein